MPPARCMNTDCGEVAPTVLSWCDGFYDDAMTLTTREMESGDIHFVCNRCYDAAVDANIAKYCPFCDEDPFDWVRKWVYNYATGRYDYVGEYSTTAIVNGYH